MVRPRSSPRFPDVTVLLGDPRAADPTKVGGVFSREDREAVERMKTALGELRDYRFRYLDDHATLAGDLLATPPAFALNLCDTGFRNDAAMELHLPALLEMLRVPYSGSPPGALSRCFDKSLVRAVAATLGIPVPEERFVSHGERDSRLPDRFPVIVKPNTGDGSLGITQQSVVEDGEQLRRRIATLQDELPGRDLILQEFLPGDEYSVCLIGNPGFGYRTLPILAVDYTGLDEGLPRILGYESKTIPDSPYWRALRYRPAELSPAATARLEEHSRLLFERLGCRDYARCDYRADTAGTLKLLEVNPNPAWCWDGKMTLMAGFAGLTEADLFDGILMTAQRRYT